MTQPENSKKTQEAARDARLKAALKANMARRKAQARGRLELDSGEVSGDSDSDNNDNNE
ncbi:MAG: hypothetical protein ABIQ85_04290 [Cypionkella sp.]|jgi:hypothetical protein